MPVDGSALLGGISSSFRTNPYTGTHLAVAAVHGPYIELKDGRTLIDFFLAHGSALLGHADARVFAAIRRVLDDGVVVGYETGLGDTVADMLAAAVPSADTCRFVASGSEAVLTAIRLARGFTGREVILKIDGQFNGGNDYVLFNSMAAGADTENPGGRLSTLKEASIGIPRSIQPSVRLVPWNDLQAIESAYDDAAGDVAAVLMVPIDFNNGCILPRPGYLEAVRELTQERGSLLIFDEVLSGFKTGLSCAQGDFGVTPDLTTLSKAMSNGVPASALVGRADIMRLLAVPLPDGVLQGGTFAGNTIGLAAAQATLEILAQPDFYRDLQSRTDYFLKELQGIFDRSTLPAQVQWIGSGFGIYLGTRDPIADVRDIRRLDTSLARSFFSRCIELGLYFHTDFTVSAAHSRGVLDEALTRLADAVAGTGPV